MVNPNGSVTEPFLTIYNTHGESCGIPPRIDNRTRNTYVAYYENIYGEQFVFLYDHKTKTGNLIGGDLDWRKEYPVVNGVPQGLILNPLEQTWLKVAWETANNQ